MNMKAQKWLRNVVYSKFPVILSFALMLAASSTVSADEADARRLLKSMTDYLAAQTTSSFQYDAVLEVVTAEGQKLALASSGSLAMQRPDKIHVTRQGGFADVELFFDGKALTILGHNLNLYTQVDAPGTLDQLVDELRNKYNRPLPAADLLLTDAYEALMHNVVDVKDLGSAVIGGVECDFLAFRAEEVDWQIWIAHGDRPYPCRYTITSKLISGGPQYSIQIRDWKAGDDVEKADFNFKNATNAEKVEMEDLKGAGDLPGNFKMGESE